MFFLFNKLNPKINFDPDSTSIVLRDQIISYKDLNDRMLSFSFFLKERGIKKDTKVSILSNNNPDFIISILSLWQLNAIPVPLNIRFTENELNEQIKFSDSQFIIVDESIDKNLDFQKAKIISLQNQNFKTKKKIHFEEPDLNSSALIMFTSGTTGKPKAVVLTFKNLISSAETGNSILNQTENDRWLASLPFYHIGGFSLFVRAFLFGASVIIPESLKTIDIISALTNKEPTLASFVSTQLKNIIEKVERPNKELRYVLLGGGFIEDELIKDAIDKNWNIIKVYGSTETSSFVTALDLNEVTGKISSAGKAVAPNEIFIVDEKKKILSNEQEGEIAVRSNSLFKEYYNNSELTKEKKSNDFYFTGDIGYIDRDNYLYVLSRRTDLIITGGENVNPVEVENKIKKFPGIEDAVVIGLEDNKWGQIVTTVYTSKEKIDEEELKDFLKEKLSRFKIPKKFIKVNSFPKTELGKINRSKLYNLISDKEVL